MQKPKSLLRKGEWSRALLLSRGNLRDRISVVKGLNASLQSFPQQRLFRRRKGGSRRASQIAYGPHKLPRHFQMVDFVRLFVA